MSKVFERENISDDEQPPVLDVSANNHPSVGMTKNIKPPKN